MVATRGGMDVAPPWRSEADMSVTFETWDQGRRGAAGLGGSPKGSRGAKRSDCVDAAGRLTSMLNGEQDRREDLADRLREGQPYYTYQQPGWPQMLSVISTAELPPVVLQRYESRQCVCLCGVFPGIRRVWTTVDTSLFLWKYEENDDVPVEYAGEDQAICAVGLVKPRLGVFIHAVNYVLAVATAVEVTLVGVCCNGPPTEPLQTISLLPLPMYSVSSDAIMFTCVATTKGGRILAGGQDGHLYEIIYSSTESWLSKRCKKMCHTSGISALLPSFFRLGWSADTLVELAIDESRGIMYARTEGGCVQVFDLGHDCEGGARKVAESGNVAAAAAQAVGGRLIGSEPRSRDRQPTASMVGIAVVDTSESDQIQLVAILSDGKRVYYSVYRNRLYTRETHNGRAAPRPVTLQLAHVRTAPPHAENSAQQASTPAGPLQVEAAFCKGGVMLLSEAGEAEVHARLLLTAVDLTLPPHMLGHAIGVTSPMSRVRGFREVVARERIDGRASSIVELLPPKQILDLICAENELATYSELATQQLLPPRRFVIMSTAGTVQVMKARPVDILCEMLERAGSEILFEFFRSFGASEAAAMCLQLVVDLPRNVSQRVAESARRALEEPQLVGEPCVEESIGLSTASQSGAIDMGHALRPPSFVFSGAHEGLLLYTARLMRSVWEKHIVNHASGQRQKGLQNFVVDADAILTPSMSPGSLKVLENKVSTLCTYLEGRKKRSSSLKRVASKGGIAMLKRSTIGARETIPMGEYSKRRRVDEAIAEEERAIDGIQALLRRSCEGLFLLRVLSEMVNFGRLALSLSQDIRQKLVTSITFRRLVSTEEGEGIASQLIAALMRSVEGSNAEEVGGMLRSGCPSFFDEEDKKFYSASSLLVLARKQGIHPSERRRLAGEALNQLQQVPLACDLATVVPEFSLLHFYEGVIMLPLRCAAAIDPVNEALRLDSDDASRSKVVKERNQCYAHITECLRTLTVPTRVEVGGAQKPDTLSSDAERESHRNALIGLALASTDELFHCFFYTAMIELGLERDLIAANPPHLERYLRQEGGLMSEPGMSLRPLKRSQVRALELLAHMYREHCQFDAAAEAFTVLAERRSGLESDECVTLIERERHMQSALLAAKSAGSDSRLGDLELRLQVLDFQKRIQEQLQEMERSSQGSGVGTGQLKRCLQELEYELKDISALYNDYSVQFSMWDMCLEILEFSKSGSEEIEVASEGAPVGATSIAMNLWDKAITKAIESQPADGALSHTSAMVSRLGLRLYPYDCSFPVHHVARRLEEIACGMWAGVAMDRFVEVNSDISGPLISRCLIEATTKDYPRVYRAYETLMSLRGGDTGVLHQPKLRLRMLKTSYEILGSWAESLRLSSASPVVRGKGVDEEPIGLVVYACDSCVAEVKRLQIPEEHAMGLAGQFRALREEVASRAAFRYR